MLCSRNSDLIEPNLEIERTIRLLLKKKREQEAKMENNEDHKALRDYAVQSALAATSCIIKPTIQANNFELKTGVIQLVQNTCQFGGGLDEDPNKHIKNFSKICDMQKHNGVSSDAIRLMLFPFSIKDKAKIWFYSLPKETITTCDEMMSAFLAKYLSPAKIAKLWSNIMTFSQIDNESIHEA